MKIIFLGSLNIDTIRQNDRCHFRPGIPGLHYMYSENVYVLFVLRFVAIHCYCVGLVTQNVFLMHVHQTLKTPPYMYFIRMVYIVRVLYY